MIAWDYLSQTAAYDPDSDMWRPPSAVPLDASECSPQSAVSRNVVLGDLCGELVLFMPDADAWRPIVHGVPPPPQITVLVPAPSGFFVIFEDWSLEHLQMKFYAPNQDR
jgi:hypothetical protein